MSKQQITESVLYACGFAKCTGGAYVPAKWEYGALQYWPKANTWYVGAQIIPEIAAPKTPDDVLRLVERYRESVVGE